MPFAARRASSASATSRRRSAGLQTSPPPSFSLRALPAAAAAFNAAWIALSLRSFPSGGAPDPEA